MKNHIHGRTVKTYILTGPIIGNLIIESGQLGNLDEITIALLGGNLVGDIELVIGSLLSIDGSPGIKRMNALLCHSLRTEILKQQIQLSQGVTDSGTTEEGGSKVFTCALLNRTDGVQQISGLLTSSRITKTRDTLMTGRKHQILELMALVNKDMVDTHRTEIYHVIGALANVKLHLVKLDR